MYEDDFESDKMKYEPLDCEMANNIRKQLQSFFGETPENIERQITNICNTLRSNVTAEMQSYIKQLVFNMWLEWMQKEGQKEIETLFTKAMKATVVCLDENNSNYIQKECQKIVLDRIKNFFASSWESRDKRDKIINKTLNEIIAKTVDEKVSDAIDELKQETIEKFQKEAMKRMMRGMAKEIASDKKLLALMTE